MSRHQHSLGVRLRRALFAVAAAALVVGLPGRAAAQSTQTVRFGFAQSAISPIIINFIVPQYLGYYKEGGLDVEILTLGTNAAVMASVDQGRIEFAVGVPSFQLPLVAKGEQLPAVNFYEYTYPFKWAVAVKPDSPVKSLSDLKRKTVGVSGFGITDFPIGKALLRLVGMDPEKDVRWLAVGQGVTGGQALVRGDIDALVGFDTGFGRLEAAGIGMRYLPLPDRVPKVGGLYISAKREFLEKHGDRAIAFARGVAKGSLFILENPEAAAWIFLQLYPEAAPRATSVEDQVKALMVSIRKRMPLYRHYDKSITQFGRIVPAEWDDEVAFMGLKGRIPDLPAFYTNELIDEINDFDREQVIKQARSFKLPYKK